MVRLAYVHWNATEAAERADRLRALGHEVFVHHEKGQSPAKALRGAEERFDAVLIDLARLPSHGVEVAAYVRNKKATATMPVVFVAGDPAKTEAALARVPATKAVAFSRLQATLRSLRAVTPPVRTATATPSAGYSGTPLAKKLGIGDGDVVVAPGAPKDLRTLLEPIPAGAELRTRFAAPFDVALLFCRSTAELDDRLPPAHDALGDGLLWVCWPKKSSGVPTDLTEDVVRKVAIDRGLVDTKVCAVDATWSGLRLSRRRRS